MVNFDPIKRQSVREFWPDEARDFTPWLADGIEDDEPSQLEDILGLDLNVLQREKAVGKYSVDIFAETIGDERTVVIENQLEASDHDHLGKCLAYAAGVDADIIVWIAPKFNDEHQDAFQWLNNNSREGVDLFALELEVWRIGDSNPGVRLNPLEEPSEWKEKAKRPEGELTETKKLQEEFWTEFRDLIREHDTPLSARKPKPHHWYDNPIGRSGFTLQFTTRSLENDLNAQLIIKDDPEAYEKFEEEKESIEATFGEELIWHPPEDAQRDSNRAKITLRRPGNIEDADRWPEYHEWMLDAGRQFHEVFYDRIQQL